MEPHQTMQEELLQSWMVMEVCIRGNRLLSDLSMNEMLICNLLRQRPEGVTATELCRHTKLLKSQMNHVLSSMEEQGLIRRQRDQRDKRSVRIYLQEAALPRYLREHDHVLGIVGRVCGQLGEEEAGQLAALMQKAAHIVSSIKEEH